MIKPKLALIPSGYSEGKLYSVLPSNGDGDFTFSRGSNATRVNKDGLIETVDEDLPRLDYSDSSCPSLLLEPQRTNLLPYSEDYSQSDYTKRNCSISQNNAISPSGENDATLVTATDSDAAISDTINVTSGLDYTLSVYLKVESGNVNTSISLGSAGFPDGEGDNGKYKNIVVTNEWQRFTITSTANASTSTVIGIIGGFSGFDSGEEVYVWGAQIEQGSYATSYIPTNGATATRLADECNSAGTSDTFNDSEGVLMTELSRFKQSGTVSYLTLGIGDGASNNEVVFKFRNYTNVFYATIKSSNGTTRTDLNYTFQDLSLNTKIALKYKTNDFALWVNGYEVVTSNNANSPIGLNELNFKNYNGGETFEGKIKKTQYYDSALTDTDLEELTSWKSFIQMANGQNYTIK